MYWVLLYKHILKWRGLVMYINIVSYLSLESQSHPKYHIRPELNQMNWY